MERPLLPPAIRACLFDLDGVLTQTARVHAAAWKEAFDAVLADQSARTGQSQPPFDDRLDYERYVDGRPRFEGARTFLAARGIQLPDGRSSDPPGLATVYGVANSKNQLLLDRLAHGQVAVFDGSIQFVRAVRALGRATAVVSSSANTRAVLAAARIADLFDTVVDGVTIDECGFAGKPAPDTFLAASTAVGVRPAAAAVFEDAVVGVQAGRAGRFGWLVGVDRTGHRDELLAAGADVVVTDLAEIAVDE
jgi:beta-phosphoglucomutase family hydrolase